MTAILLRVLNTRSDTVAYFALPWHDLATGLARLANWLPNQDPTNPARVSREAQRPHPLGLGAARVSKADGARAIQNPTGTEAIVTLQLDPSARVADVRTHERILDSLEITGTARVTSEDNREAHRLAATFLEAATERHDVTDPDDQSPDHLEKHNTLWREHADQQERARHIISTARARREGELREAAAQALPLLQAIAEGYPIDREAAHGAVDRAASVIGPANNLRGLIPETDE